MINFTIYEEATGKIIVSGTAPNLEEQWLDEGEVIVEGMLDPSAQYIRDGVAVSYPPKTHPSMIYDYASHAWVDPRDAEQHQADLDRAKTEGIATVNRISGEVRKQFVTDIPAQEMLYVQKNEEAIQYLADPNPDPANYPLITAEIGITAPTAWDVAQVYVNMAFILKTTAARLETVRLGAIAQIEQAQHEDEIQPMLTAFQEGIIDHA